MAQFITSIRIKNFRSIVDQTFDLHNESLSILVGRNDVGKSNVLKALNLFFNGQTGASTSFRFDDDYSFIAETGKGKAREVLVDLTITPPSRLKNSKPVRWIKTWRGDNLQLETKFSYNDGMPIGPRSGIHQWLRKLKYRYVPAEKGTAYFPQLMSELHDVMNDVHAIEFNESAFGFVEEIQNISKDLASELEKLIGLSSRIQAPSDFRTLFANLDFGENLDGSTYHLRRRGDGIRAWHIPIILKVMAKKEQEAKQYGRVRPDTIWGFEEPENNLELTNAFKVARQIYDFSDDIQIFLTTHSPAFYALAGDNHARAKSYHLVKDSKRITRLGSNDVTEIDRQMGVLELVTPYLKEANDEREQLKAMVEELTKKTINEPVVVLSEDKDNCLLECIIRSSGIENFEILSYKGCGNVNAALGMARIIHEKAPETHIIVHRDRDYLSTEEINEIELSAKRSNCILFLTRGNDLESHFLDPKYIASVSKITEEEASECIEAATENVRSKSLDKFSGAVLNGSKRQKERWNISKFENEYESNVSRFRHGKSVLGELKSIIHKKTGSRLVVGKEHERLAVSEICAINSVN